MAYCLVVALHIFGNLIKGMDKYFPLFVHDKELFFGQNDKRRVYFLISSENKIRFFFLTLLEIFIRQNDKFDDDFQIR